ncbi:MAG: universal stress protein [Cytophagales bacterium]|nr:MAG: universal stress protein [Cytophagales bacterium]
MKKILIPTDFSNNAAKAVKFAMRLGHNSASLHLVFFHATQTIIPTQTPSRLYAEIRENDIEEGLAKLKKEIHQHLKELDILPEEISSELVVVQGDFKEHINNEVKRLGATLIIMGTCGASGLQKVLFGSNTVDVMEKVDCPVLAIPDNYKYHAVKHIAYAADFLSIEEGFEKVVNLAKMFEASLEIFHVDSVLPHRIDHQTFDKTHFVDNLKRKFGYESMSLEFVEMEEEDSDDALAGIYAYIARRHPSILAMATYDRIWIEKIISPSVTKEMMFQTEIPLFAFRKKGNQG